jgi:hypothetical protein
MMKKKTHQVTHGFPQNPSPAFRSHHFAIENRPGLEEQSIERVMRSLNELGAPDLSTSTSRQGGGGGGSHRRLELAKWLSDWHLVAFLGTCGLLSEVSNLFGAQLTFFPSFSCVPVFPVAHLKMLGRRESVRSCCYSGHR